MFSSNLFVIINPVNQSILNLITIYFHKYGSKDIVLYFNDCVKGLLRTVMELENNS